MTEFFKNRLSPFRHLDFTLFFSAQTISMVGSWAHDLARAWIIITLMGKAGALGMVLLMGALPGLLLFFYTGSLVDRINVRKLMMITKSLFAFFTLILALIVEFHTPQVWHFIVYAFMDGAITAFDSPAFQALTVRLVPRADFQQAVALNSMNFHLARMLGPLLAGLLMYLHGPSLVLFFDAITYLGVVVILYYVNLTEVLSSKPQGSAFTLFKEGVAYLKRNVHMRFMMIQLWLTIGLFIPMYIAVMRTYLKLKFNLDAHEFGQVFAYPPLGSLLGALTVTMSKPKRPLNFLYPGVPLAAIGILLIPLAPTALGAAILLSITSFGSFLCFSSLTMSIHLSVEEQYRGRMSSVVGLGFVCVGPLLAYPIGVFADFIGYANATVFISVGFLIFTLIHVLMYKNAIQKQGLLTPK